MNGKEKKVEHPLRFGLVGAGIWGEAHAEVYSRSPFSLFSAVCDVDRGKAENIAGRFGPGVEVYTDAKQMFEKAHIDAVGIATPDFLHRDVAIAAAEAGKHIFLEKPLATTLEDITAIAEAVKKNKVRIMVDFHARWNPAMYQAKQSIANGELGSIVSAYFRLNDTVFVPTGMLSWASKSSVLWFLGSHTVDTLRWFFEDEVKRVYSVSRSEVLVKKGIDVPDIYQSILEFRSGVIATIENNWIVPNTQPNVNDIKINVLGTEGMVDIDLTNHGVVKRFLKDGHDMPDLFVKPHIHDRHRGFAYWSMYDFVERLYDGSEFLVGLQDGINVTKVVLAIMESAKKRMPIEVNY